MIPVVANVRVDHDHAATAHELASRLVGVMADAQAAGRPLKLAIDVDSPGGVNVLTGDAMRGRLRLTIEAPAEVKWIEVKE